MTENESNRHTGLYYEDEQYTDDVDDVPALTPYHSTLDGRQGVVTLPQATTDRSQGKCCNTVCSAPCLECSGIG